MKTFHASFIVLVFFLSFTLTGVSQNAKIDSLKTALANKAIGNKEGTSFILRSIGVAYFDIGDYTEAINYYEKALQISKEINNEDMTSRCLLNIGNIHLVRGNYPLALEFHNKSLAINEKRKDSLMISLSLSNIGHIYRNLENYDKALTYSKKALNIQKRVGDKKRTLETLINLGITYTQLEDFEHAENVLKEALIISKEINNKHLMGFALNNIGYVYLQKEDDITSLKYYEQARATNFNIDSQRSLMGSYYGVAKTNAKLKKYNIALSNALKSHHLAQKLNILSFERDIMQLLSEIYEKTGDFKKAYQSHQQFKIANDSLFNKENIKKIAQLEYEYKYRQALDSASIRELQLTKTVKSTSQDLEKSQRNYLWAIIGVLLVSILLGAIIFYQKLGHVKSKTENIVMEQKLLRSQMTPHFIFNSLSVLQGMILNKEEKKAVYYLSKFSKLLRITLENSRDKMVSLSQELMAIQDYLTLQNLENEAYNYTVLVDESINVPAFDVPAMLIQPFVENAIEHAFINQKEHRKIDLRLTYSDDKLICTISDNGVGINYENGNKRKDKKSLATTITSERLKILSKDLKMQGSVMVEDRQIYGEQGTIVTLEIPHKII